MKHLIPRTLNFLGLLPLLNIRCKIILNKKKIIIPIINKLGLQHIVVKSSWIGIISKEILNLKSGYFIDIGVNLGQTLLQLRSNDRDVPYIGFEPNISCVYYLNHLINLNGFSHTKIIPVGLYDQMSLLKFYLRRDDDSGATFQNDLRPDFFKKNSFQLIPTALLDDILTSKLEINEVAMIKIDVEGSELEVIKGALSTIKKMRPFVICEVLDYYSDDVMQSHKERADTLYQLMQSIHYKALKIILDKNDNIRDFIFVNCITLKQWEKVSRYENDYLFYPTEYHDSIHDVFKKVKDLNRTIGGK